MSKASIRARAAGAWAWRIAVLLCLALAVAGLALFLLGPPSMARVYHQDEIARFAPTFGHGLGQLLGESFLVGLVAYVGRRWLRVHL